MFLQKSAEIEKESPRAHEAKGALGQRQAGRHGATHAIVEGELLRLRKTCFWWFFLVGSVSLFDIYDPTKFMFFPNSVSYPKSAFLVNLVFGWI